MPKDMDAAKKKQVKPRKLKLLPPVEKRTKKTKTAPRKRRGAGPLDAFVKLAPPKPVVIGPESYSNPLFWDEETTRPQPSPPPQQPDEHSAASKSTKIRKKR